jgi:hypothetical protein
MTIETKTVYEADDGKKFDTLNQAQNYGRTLVYEELFNVVVGLPTYATFNPKQRDILWQYTKDWEQNRPTDAQIQALIDAKNEPS